jgi:hypothetical protein
MNKWLLFGKAIAAAVTGARRREYTHSKNKLKISGSSLRRWAVEVVDSVKELLNMAAK